MVGSFSDKPSFAPGNPTFSRPVRSGLRPVMNAARPAVQDCLAVIIREDRAFVCDAIDVGRAITHHAAVVRTDVPVTDIVRHDDDDVWLL